MLSVTTRNAALPRASRPLFERLFAGVRRSAELRRSRRALAGLTAEQLADVGITRAQAETEARRPVWDAPRHWQG